MRTSREVMVSPTHLILKTFPLKYLAIVLVSLVILISLHSETLVSQEKPDPMNKAIWVGMPLKAFKKHYPKADPKDEQTKPVKIISQWSKTSKIFNMKGKWYFRFKNKKLSWYSFSFYITDYKKLNKSNFQRSLKGTEKIINYLSKLYGKPRERVDGIKHFKDPFKQRHFGYNIVKVKWKTKKETIQVNFHFFGAKGRYFFVVNAKFFDKDYKY